MSSSHALLQGLRRSGDEPQLTQALHAVLRADPEFAAAFVRAVIFRLDATVAECVPNALTCTAEEIVDEGRLDLRFRGHEWDVITELKIHAGYGKDQLARYLRALGDEPNQYLVAITRDVPTYGEPPAGAYPGWLGAVRWRSLLGDLRPLRVADGQLAAQWPPFFDVLELEGSMGFTRPNPEMFDLYAESRLANKHMEDFLRSIEHPLLLALVEAQGGDPESASFYFRGGGRLSWARWGKVDIPFRVPAETGPVRVRAGVMGWSPPSTFFVEPHVGRQWILKSRRGELSGQQERAVRFLIDRGFEPEYLRAHLGLNESLLASSTFEDEILAWARARFGEIVQSEVLRTEPPVKESEDDAVEGDG